ncbi:hypothetical protein Droror1_Dr00002248, partial [Drosera rotundifolia]
MEDKHTIYEQGKAMPRRKMIECANWQMRNNTEKRRLMGEKSNKDERERESLRKKKKQNREVISEEGEATLEEGKRSKSWADGAEDLSKGEEVSGLGETSYMVPGSTMIQDVLKPSLAMSFAEVDPGVERRNVAMNNDQ